MVLMIFPVSSLERVISPMDWAMSSISLPTSLTIFCVSAIRPLAWAAFSAVCFVMDDISSSEADDFSRADACFEVPAARFWLADDTWPEAVETWSDGH